MKQIYPKFLSRHVFNEIFKIQMLKVRFWHFLKPCHHSILKYTEDFFEHILMLSTYLFFMFFPHRPWLGPWTCSPPQRADCPRSICAPQTPAWPRTPRRCPTWSPCSRRMTRSCPRYPCRKISVLHPLRQILGLRKGDYILTCSSMCHSQDISVWTLHLL
mgnify:CR=1 FL=1